jgi:hypothetical protein
MDSLKQQYDVQYPDEGADMEADEDELMEQGVAQLRGQLEEDEFDEEMDMGRSEDLGDGVASAAGAKEQNMGNEEAKHQPEHIGEEKDIIDNSSTLPFRSL